MWLPACSQAPIQVAYVASVSAGFTHVWSIFRFLAAQKFIFLNFSTATELCYLSAVGLGFLYYTLLLVRHTRPTFSTNIIIRCKSKTLVIYLHLHRVLIDLMLFVLVIIITVFDVLGQSIENRFIVQYASINRCNQKWPKPQFHKLLITQHSFNSYLKYFAMDAVSL